MRRQGPDPRGSRFGDRSRLPGASGADRRLRGLREEDRSPGAENPGWTFRATGMQAPGLSHPSARLALGSSAAGAKENSRENLLRWRGSPPSRSAGPAIRFEANRRICRSSRRVTGDHRTTSRPPAPKPLPSSRGLCTCGPRSSALTSHDAILGEACARGNGAHVCYARFLCIRRRKLHSSSPAFSTAGSPRATERLPNPGRARNATRAARVGVAARRPRIP